MNCIWFVYWHVLSSYEQTKGMPWLENWVWYLIQETNNIIRLLAYVSTGWLNHHLVVNRSRMLPTWQTNYLRFGFLLREYIWNTIKIMACSLDHRLLLRFRHHGNPCYPLPQSGLTGLFSISFPGCLLGKTPPKFKHVYKNTSVNGGLPKDKLQVLYGQNGRSCRGHDPTWLAVMHLWCWIVN